MQVRLLGPLEVVTEDEDGGPPGTGERALLAVLALRAGQVVSADHLVDALWGEDLPANPANALQLRVSKLRRWLGGLGLDPSVLATRSPGYLLDVAPTSVDALVVVDELAAARAAAGDGSTAVAVERFRAALRRWSGVPLTDVPATEWARAEAARLEELRLGALEAVLDLELQLGRHDLVLDELDALVAGHPLRERFHGALMLALYRAGRQADALAAYQDLRRLLGEELGLDPSEELRRLEAAILRHDPELDLPAADADALTAPELPRRVASFRGREGEVDELVGLLGTERVVTCTGPGGTGKTTLAVEVARRAASAFRSGAWLIGLAGVTAVDDLSTTVGAALGLPPSVPDPGETPHERLARQLGARHALLVLDNCEHVIDAAAALVEVVVTRCPNATVLATSREPLGVPGEVRFAVAPLGVPDPADDPDQVRRAAAVELFCDRARALDRSFDPDDGDVVAIGGICRRLDGLPLAVELAAARTTTLSVPEIADRLGDHLGLLTGGPRTADARHRTIREAVRWSYQLLDPEEQLLFRRLSVFRSPWDLTAAEGVCADRGLPPGALLDLVGALVDRSLVVRARPGRFRLLEPIRQFAAAELDASGDAATVARRHLAWFTTFAEATAPELRAGDQRGALERLALVNDDLRQALALATEAPTAHGVDGLRLAAALAWFWYLGDHEEGRRQLRQVLDADVPDAGAEVRARALLGVAAVERPSACIVHPSDVGAAAARRAVEAFTSAGDGHGAALARVLTAVEGVRGTDVTAALRSLDEASAPLAAAGDEWALALVEFVRMEVLMRTSGGAEAIEHGNRAADAFARLGDLWGLSAVRGHQGANLRLLGELDAAVSSYRTALDLARDVGLQNSLRLVGAELGVLLASMGDAEGAHRSLEESRRYARRTGARAPQAATHLGHAHLARWSDDPAGAVAEYERAASGLTDVGALFFAVDAHSGVGFCRELLGDLDAAAAAHAQVAELADAVAEPRMRALALEGRAGVHAAAGDTDPAATLLREATELRRRSHRPATPLEQRDIDRVAAAVGGTDAW
jgi:predicted ATPase/DNA-binding SARP family transcriptional activator